jgi:mannose-6-phosphate isomerase-like protein (cupin superfamily)
MWVLGDLYRFLATSEDTGGTYALWETTATPGLPGPPPHIHHNEDEAFYVLEGQLELFVDGSVSTAGPGSFVNIPRGTLHTFKNAGTTPVRMLGMVAPGGFEGFFVEVGEPAADPSSPPEGPPDVERVIATAPKYGLEIPPPPQV